MNGPLTRIRILKNGSEWIRTKENNDGQWPLSINQKVSPTFILEGHLICYLLFIICYLLLPY